MKALAISLLVAIAVVAQADLRSDIASSNRQIHAAMMKKDMKALDQIFKAGMTKDFVYTENGQKQSYAQMMAGMKMGFQSLTKMTKVDTKIKSVQEKGNMGTCMSEHMMEGWTMGKDKKQHKMAFIGMAKETYRKVGGHWKMARMDWTASKMTMDGKAVPMGG